MPTPSSSTAQMNEKLLAALTPARQNSEQQKSYYLQFKLASHYLYNFTNTFIKTGFSSALLTTDSLALEEVYGGMSWAGIAVGIVLGLYFGWCEADAHNAESKHFNHSDDNPILDLENPPVPQTETQPAASNDPTVKQYLKAAGHYVGDVIGGVEPCMFFAKKALGIDAISPLARGFSYLGFGVYSWLGNLQEWGNTMTAYKEDNAREQRNSPTLRQ